MTTSDLHREVEATPPAALATVDTADAFARKLYRRARNAGPDFEDAALVVRDLYTVLKHLKVEAEDPESLLNSDKSGVHIRQLSPIIEDTEFALRQLDAILESYFDSGAHGTGVSSDGERHTLANDGERGWTMLDSVGPKKIDLIRNKLDSEKLKIDMFIDLIQSHNPSKSRLVVATRASDEDLPLLQTSPFLAELSEEYPGCPDIDNETFFPTTKMERLGYVEYSPQHAPLATRSSGPSDNQDKASPDSVSFISTWELMKAREMFNLPTITESWPGPPSTRWSPVATISQTSSLGRISSDVVPTTSAKDPISQQSARLKPDTQGREIPLDAKWTRIRRKLVSPEVLAREGLRYEAQPDFVAVLGELKKDEVADLAKKSSEVRHERERAATNATSTPIQAKSSEREKRPVGRYHPDESRNWDANKDRRDQDDGPGYVINPHHHPRANSTVSSTGELWDSSDDEPSDGFSGDHATTTRYSNSYPPSSRPRPSSYYHNSSPSRGPRNGATPTSNNGDSKGTKVYPFIVPPPVREEGSHGKPSPSATVKPKPILKNKNDDPHVRFDPEPQILDDSSSSAPQNTSRRDRGREASQREYRDRDRDRLQIQDRERGRTYRSHGYHHQDRNRDHEREYRHHGRSSKYHPSSGRDDRDYHRQSREGRSRERDRERYRDRERSRDKGRKKSRSEAFRVAGISGAAAGLMSMLTEAAAGL